MPDMPNEIWLADPELARDDDRWAYETRESLAENSHVRERFTIKYIPSDEVADLILQAIHLHRMGKDPLEVLKDV